MELNYNILLCFHSNSKLHLRRANHSCCQTKSPGVLMHVWSWLVSRSHIWLKSSHSSRSRKHKPISGQVNKAFATEAIDPGSINLRVKPKTIWNLEFMTFLLNLQREKKSVKSQSCVVYTGGQAATWLKSWRFSWPIWLSVAVRNKTHYFILLYTRCFYNFTPGKVDQTCF